MAEKRSGSERELIDTGNDKRLSGATGRAVSTSRGRWQVALAQDVRKHAKTRSRQGRATAAIKNGDDE